MGIFEKVDQSGLDIQYAIEEYLVSELDRGTDPNPMATRLVEQDDLGLKTRQGVYDWSDRTPAAVYDQRDRDLLEHSTSTTNSHSALPPGSWASDSAGTGCAVVARSQP